MAWHVLTLRRAAARWPARWSAVRLAAHGSARRHMCSVLQADLIPEQPEADSGAGAGAATAAAVAQAVKLLNDQEGRGIAADVGDALVASAQHHSGLQDAVLRYFRRMAEASPDIESFTARQ